MRIASLVPGATEMICALGLEEGLIAVSHECDHPPQAVEGLPRITRSILPSGLSPAAVDEAVNRAVAEGRPLYEVDADLLLDLEPDLVVTQGVCDVCAVSPETLVPLRSRLPARTRLVTLSARSWEGVLEDLRQLGEAAGVPAQAETLAEELRSRWQELPGASGEGAPRVLMLEWPDPPFYGGHWVPEMVRAAGGVAVLGEVGKPSRRTTWEAVAAADPDLVVAIGCGYDTRTNAEQARRLYAHPRAGLLRALQNGALWAADANSYFSRPGPRLVRGAELLAGLFAGEPCRGEELVPVEP